MSSVTLWLESTLHSCHSPRSVYFVRSWYWDTMAGAFKTNTDDVKAAVLQKYDVHDDITAFRCNRIRSQVVFIALDRTVEGITETLKEAFGVDASQGFTHKRELAELIAAWEESKIQSETKNKVDAVARAHGEPISHVPADWESIMKGFKQKHGANTPEYYFPSQSYVKPSTRRSTKAGFVRRLLHKWSVSKKRRRFRGPNQNSQSSCT